MILRLWCKSHIKSGSDLKLASEGFLQLLDMPIGIVDGLVQLRIETGDLLRQSAR